MVLMDLTSAYGGIRLISQGLGEPANAKRCGRASRMTRGARGEY